MTYKAKIHEVDYSVKGHNNLWSLNAKEFSIQPSPRSNRLLLITDNNDNVHEALILELDEEKKQIKIQVNLKEITIDLLDPMDIKMLSLGIDTKKLSKAKNIKAPMPGLILKTLVKEGQEVKSGDALFILEAMKMENVFKAPDDVIIKDILISNGQTVDKNQELIVFA